MIVGRGVMIQENHIAIYCDTPNCGHIVFVLSVCLFVVILTCCNIWTVRGRNFIFASHTLLRKSFQNVSKLLMTLSLVKLFTENGL